MAMLGGITQGINVNDYYKNGEMAGTAVAGNVRNDEDASALSEKTKKLQGIEECQTCKNRKYQDGSNDPGVSFKSPTKMTPGQAASAVYSHEREHYTRESSKANREGREVVSNDIRVYTSVCPECGKTYVSGGQTRTVTRNKEQQESFAQKFFDENVGKYLPDQLNMKA